MDLKKPRVIYQERGHQSLDKENNGGTEYLSKLTLRRDAMVQQEQTRLAQALSRLGIQSSLNKDHSFRLRMNGSDTHNSLSPLERTSLTTAVEKFRQTRQAQQKQHHQLLATLLPLEGRQIFHRNLATSGGNNVQNKNSNRMVAEGNGNHGNSQSSLSLSEGERTTRKEKKRSNKTTKELGDISRNLLPQYYYIEAKLSNRQKVRPKIKEAAGQNRSSLPPADNLGLVTSQASLYYYPRTSHENAPSFWHPGVTSLASESPDANVYNSPQTAGNTRRRRKHRFDQPVDHVSFDDDMLEVGVQEQAAKGEIDKSRQTRTSVILPSITEHPSLELVCSKCIASKKKQMSNRMVSKSAADFHDRPPILLETNSNSTDMNSGNIDDEVRKSPVKSQQSPMKFHGKYNVRKLEDEPDEDNMDWMVTSLPEISHHVSFSHRYGRASMTRFYGSQRTRNGLKLHTILADHVERPLEIGNLKMLDPGPETNRSKPRKINIVVDMPDTQLRSTTSDSDQSSDEEREHPTVVKWADSNTTQLKPRHAVSRK